MHQAAVPAAAADGMSDISIPLVLMRVML